MLGQTVSRKPAVDADQRRTTLGCKPPTQGLLAAARWTVEQHPTPGWELSHPAVIICRISASQSNQSGSVTGNQQSINQSINQSAKLLRQYQKHPVKQQEKR